jgi:hypothetical protein
VCPVRRDVRSRLATSRHTQAVATPFACSTATQEKVESWLKIGDAPFSDAELCPEQIYGSTSSVPESAMHSAKQTSVILKVGAVIQLIYLVVLTVSAVC